MSDQSQGHGWWQASDGKWYPPESAPPSVFTSVGAPAIPSGPGTSTEQPWYEKTWVVVLSLLFCFPLGLVIVWINKRFTQKTKVVITGVVLVLAVIGGISSAASPPEEPEKAAPALITEEPTTTEVSTTTEASTTTAAPTTTEPPISTTTVPPTTTAPPEPALTPSQQQAVRSAEGYLDYSGFSRQGLIGQLSSEL